MHTFYQPDLLSDAILLSEEESKHCVRVLRVKKGDRVTLVDGKGTSATALVIDDHPKKCLLHIENKQHHATHRNYYLHMLVSPTKNFDRMEWFLEKAVEAGIDEISFLLCDNSERTRVPMERCEKVAISAMKQSKQFWLPKINGMKYFTEALQEQRHNGITLLAWCEADSSQTLQHLIQPMHNTPPVSSANQTICILIGPEGDFSKTEADTAILMDFKPVSFGASRLRTETAALFACIATHVLRS
jgi:16S rRNA (uracil1498-N3)-methyltransferase